MYCTVYGARVERYGSNIICPSSRTNNTTITMILFYSNSNSSIISTVGSNSVMVLLYMYNNRLILYNVQ